MLVAWHAKARREGRESIAWRIVNRHTHPASAELLDDAVVRNGLADERLGLGHLARILGCELGQVNDTTQRHVAKRDGRKKSGNARGGPFLPS